MRGKTNPKVVVVGAGPVGLTTALTFNKRGIPVSVIERDDRPGTHSYALALHSRTAEMLDEWGILDSLRKESLQVDRLVYCDVDGPRYTLDLKSLSGHESGLMVVGQDHLETALMAPLEQANVPLNWNCRLSELQQNETGVNLKMEHLMEGMSGYAMARLEWQVDKEISASTQYLVGADGHFSMVRRRSGIEFPRIAPTQSFAVFEFKSDYAHENEARIVLGDEGTSVLWPLPGGYCRWGFEIVDSAAESFSRDKDRLFVQIGNQGYQVLESRMLEELIQSRAPWFDGSIDAFRWRMIVRFEKRLAKQFGRGRVWLAGDAGHMTGPVGMQSMNIGMVEGQVLANSLADVIEERTDTSVLDAYNADRENEWKALAGISRAFSARADTDPFIAANVNRLMGCIPATVDSLPAFAEAFGVELVRN